LGGSVRVLKKNRETLVVAGMEIGLEVSDDKTKYMVMSQDRNAGQSHSIKTDDSSFERVEEFRYLGATLMNQNSIQEEIKEQVEVRECLLSISAESFVLQFAIKKCKD